MAAATERRQAGAFVALLDGRTGGRATGRGAAIVRARAQQAGDVATRCDPRRGRAVTMSSDGGLWCGGEVEMLQQT